MNARLLVGDVRDTLRELPDASVHMVCTSPPYWRLRPPYCVILGL